MSKIARVQLADGRVARLEVPDDFTPEQAMAAAKQYSAPKPKAAKAGGVGLLSTLNEALIGGAEGIYNAASAVTDPIAKKVISLIQGPEAAEAVMRRANQGRRGVTDAAEAAFVRNANPVARTVGRIGGALAIPLPGGKLQEGGRVARGAYRAMQGAVGGAAVRDVDEDAATPAGIGAASNVVLPPIVSRLAQTRPAQAVGGAVSKAAAPVVNYLIGKADDAASAMLPNASRPLAPLGRKAEARAARFKASGVDKPTTGMVTREPGAFSFEQNQSRVQGVGDDLATQIRDVEDGLVKKGRQLVDKAGGSKGAEATGKSVQEALDAKRGEMQQVTSRLYDRVREDRGDEVVGALENLSDLMTDPDMTDNATLDQMRESLSRRMVRLGLGEEGGGGATVKQAEDLRKFIRGLGSNAEPTVHRARRMLIDALDDDVVNAVGDDAFKAARASAKARFDEFSKTFAGRIADEGVAPERLAKRVLSESTSLADLRAMRESLLSGSDDQIARGKEAWQGLRAQALDDLLSKSRNEEGKLLGGQLSRDFVKQSAKLRELLEPADYKELRRLVLASRDATVAPPGSSVNYSGTATTLANMFQSAKPQVRESWAKFLAKNGVQHGIAAAASFPAANIALEVGKRAMGSLAEQRAAQALLRKVQMAQSPEEAAAAIAAMKQVKSNPMVASFLEKYGAAVGGTVAGASQ